MNAEVINPFIKIGGAEFFGSFETATGGAFTEPKLRTLHQNVYEGLYRFGEATSSSTSAAGTTRSRAS